MIPFICLSEQSPKYFSKEEMIRISLVKWYKLGHSIYILARESPFETGETEMFWPFVMRKIPYSLYRWDDSDGFYHA